MPAASGPSKAMISDAFPGSADRAPADRRLAGLRQLLLVGFLVQFCDRSSSLSVCDGRSPARSVAPPARCRASFGQMLADGFVHNMADGQRAVVVVGPLDDRPRRVPVLRHPQYIVRPPPGWSCRSSAGPSSPWSPAMPCADPSPLPSAVSSARLGEWNQNLSTSAPSFTSMASNRLISSSVSPSRRASFSFPMRSAIGCEYQEPEKYRSFPFGSAPSPVAP